MSKRVLHSAENFVFRYCTLVRSLFPRLIGLYQHILQIYLIASKLICARVNINTNPMFQYFLRILGKKYFDMCPLGTKQRIPNSLFKLSLHKRIFLTNVGKPSRPFKFQHLIWQARNIFYNNVHKTKKTENSLFVIFSDMVDTLCWDGQENFQELKALTYRSEFPTSK